MIKMSYGDVFDVVTNGTGVYRNSSRNNATISFVAKFKYMRDVIGVLAYLGYKMRDVHLSDAFADGYDDLYLCTLSDVYGDGTTPEIFCEPLWNGERYLDTWDEYIYIIGDYNAECLEHLHGEAVIVAEVGEDEDDEDDEDYPWDVDCEHDDFWDDDDDEDDDDDDCEGCEDYEKCHDVELKSRSETQTVSRNEDGEPVGFTKSWYTNDDGVGCSSSFSFYTSDIDELKSVAREFDVTL